MAEIKIEIKNIAQIKDAFGKSPALMAKNLNESIRQIVLLIRERAVTNAPIRSGILRGSAYTDYGNLRGEIGFNAKYAGWVHDGTSPYIIRPKSKKALYWKGASHPVMQVNHPGIRANPYLKRAVEDSQLQVDKFLQVAVQDTLDEIGKETR